MASDLFQTAFLKLHQARHRYDPALPFAPWLFTITQRVLIDHYRKAGAERDAESAFGFPEIPALDGAKDRLPSLGSLNATQREAIELRFGKDLPFEEIAKKLGTSKVNVRQIVSRAVRKLRGSR
jgi:RNA polymerase sigma-70 factor (ECF subfamily)